MRDGQPAEGKSLTRLPVTAGMLAVLGVLTVATGVHFLLLRPAMLPEDIRFTGVTPDRLPPRMIEWLGIVFRTWGGFMAGFGILLLGISAHLFTLRRAFLSWGTAIAIGIAFGRFVLSNVKIGSDYVFFIGGLFGLALVVALFLILPSGRRPKP
jgi:hypothetical protein